MTGNRTVCEARIKMQTKSPVEYESLRFSWEHIVNGLAHEGMYSFVSDECLMHVSILSDTQTFIPFISGGTKYDQEIDYDMKECDSLEDVLNAILTPILCINGSDMSHNSMNYIRSDSDVTSMCMKRNSLPVSSPVSMYANSSEIYFNENGVASISNLCKFTDVTVYPSHDHYMNVNGYAVRISPYPLTFKII